MEKINFFLAEKRLASCKVLRHYLCDDLILKICDYSIIDKNLLDYKKEINKTIKWWVDNFFLITDETQTADRVKSIFYLLTDKYHDMYIKCNIQPHKDMIRIGYLKNKMGEKQKGHYSKYYNTWIKFQYFLSKSAYYNCREKNVKYGFIGIKRLSDVLYQE
tara:strand:+ start:2962 stop:3444 length:483 start_codon:yes stop_codon:yes gene_type:complete